MTKIAISPNVNGTGTFTIAAPDSNTDRTLTLPDAGGEVFSQGNIIGTVSESSGVPTGAIIQRGSNSNGEFVRFADGTQICTRPQFIVSFANNSRLSNSFNYPATFSVPPAVFGQYAIKLFTYLDTDLNLTKTEAITTTSCFVSLWRNTGGVNYVSGNTAELNMIAIGRWF